MIRSPRPPSVTARVACIFLMLAALALVSCTAAPAPTATSTRPVAPTATSTPIPTATPTHIPTPTPTSRPTHTPTPTPTPLHPMSIAYMRQQTYAGSDLVIEQTLTPGVNYDRYIASHQSEGLTIYGLLTVPRGERPEPGWPIILLNHGYIPPSVYRTAERYVAYQDAFARNGYITFKSDYRGHGDSEGDPSGGSRGPGYTVDVLNAVASLQRHPDADPERVGMWGHSMGGGIILRAMVVSDAIDAGVIWAGTVATYEETYQDRPRWVGAEDTPLAEQPRVGLFAYGMFDEAPEFWAAIDPITYLSDLSGPVQIHHATGDQSVPVAWSERLYERLQNAGQTAELFLYQGDNHNISANFSTAAQRSIEFFDRHVKGTGAD